MTMMRTRHWFSLALLLALTLGGTAAAQDAFPSRSFRIVVPYSAGGTADVLARLIGQHLGALYGQQVVIDNRPGAGGHIGADMVAKSPADGYTMVLGALGTHARDAIYKKLPYQPTKDLQGITVLGQVAHV